MMNTIITITMITIKTIYLSKLTIKNVKSFNEFYGPSLKHQNNSKCFSIEERVLNRTGGIKELISSSYPLIDEGVLRI